MKYIKNYNLNSKRGNEVMSWKIRFEIEISGVKDMETANNIGKEFSITLRKTTDNFLEDLDIPEFNVIIKNSKEIER